MDERERRLEVARAFEVLRVLAEQAGGFRGRAGALVIGDRLVGEALAGVDPAGGEQRESHVRLRRGHQREVVEGARDVERGTRELVRRR